MWVKETHFNWDTQTHITSKLWRSVTPIWLISMKFSLFCNALLGGEILMLYNSLMGGCREESQTLLKSTLLEGQETKGKVEHSSFQLNIRKKRFLPQGRSDTGMGTQRSWGITTFGDIENSVGQGPEHPDWTGRRAGLADLWKFLPTSSFCQDFTKVCVFPFTTGVFSWISI